jgi:hypothetical protein
MVVVAVAVVAGAAVVVGTAVVVAFVGTAVVMFISVVGTAVVMLTSVVGTAVVMFTSVVGTAVVGSPGRGSVGTAGVAEPVGTSNMLRRHPGTPDLTIPQNAPAGQFPLGKPPTQMGIGAHSVVPISTDTGSSPAGQFGSSGLRASLCARSASKNTAVGQALVRIIVYTMVKKK